MALAEDFSIAPILHHITHYLTNHERQYFYQQTRRIAQENNKLRAQQHKGVTTGFIFDGVAYVLPEHDFKSPNLVGLELHLQPEMEVLLAEQTARDREIKNVSQVLFLICKESASSFQDLRDTLPECLVPAFPQLACLDRSRQPAYSIQDNPFLLNKWNAILPRIEYYTATRLLY